jgi:hypothetical protein
LSTTWAPTHRHRRARDGVEEEFGTIPDLDAEKITRASEAVDHRLHAKTKK